ncbi:MAG TPA: dTDP-4-dehydrorhamnose reductase [Candidatus Saccharimonadales bacterium]|jgi:dTDP-4-dehydrorhamnose reductase|nr:dTDP-4-dehydrorhamnose reductase [Candidatus Saccharimonadales bacterium]
MLFPGRCIDSHGHCTIAEEFTRNERAEVMKVAVIGANGQLGQDVTAAFRAAEHEVAALTHSEIEISSPESVQRVLGGLRPDLVVNTAAFHNVDKCESEADPAFRVNSLGARYLAQSARELQAKLVHISTDYVFDGRKRSPYLESDSPHPLNVYGNSKLAGEFFVMNGTPRHFVVRVSGIYGRHLCRAKGSPNFVETMLARGAKGEMIRMVDDQFVTPTPTAEIAQQVAALAATEEYGLYHATSEGSCSWYEFTRTIFELAGMNVDVHPIKSGDSGRAAIRPAYSVLENAALKSKSMNLFRHWRVGLENYLIERAQTQPQA